MNDFMSDRFSKAIPPMKKHRKGGITMLKRMSFLAAFLLIGGIASAEPLPGKEGPESYRLYKASDVAAGTNKIANSAFLHKVIISSPSASATSEIEIHNTQGGATQEVFTVQADTTNVTGLTEWTFDVYLSSGLTAKYTASAATGAVTLVYGSGPQQDYKVWQSSFIVADTSTHTIAAGPVLLHKVMVLKKGAGTSVLGIYNQNSATTLSANRIADIDMVDGAREYVFNVMLSSGLTVMSPTAGTTAPEYVLIYKKNPPRDWEAWSVYHTTATFTTKAIFAGRGVFGGILNGDVDATSQITLYNANGTATNPITKVDGDKQFSRSMYDVNVSSGLTFTNVGNGRYSILYRRLR
jgi:hypothetical protein